MAEWADGSELKQTPRMKGKFASRIKSWRSSILKHMNQKRDVGEIQQDYDYFYDKNAVCPSVLSPVDVPDAATHLNIKNQDSMISDDIMEKQLLKLNI